MAKYETMLTGSFDVVLNALHDGIMNASSTASYEDGSDYRMGSVRFRRQPGDAFQNQYMG